MKKTLQMIVAGGIFAGLAGCGSDGVLGTGVGSGASGVPQQTGTPATSTLGTFRNYVLYGGATVPDALPKELSQREIDCPKIDVLEGTAALRVATASEGAVGINYQVSMGQTARECRIDGNRIFIKVGVEGRVLIGTNGKPGTYPVPIRIVVKREKEVIFSKLTRISVTIPSNDTQASFTHIEEGISLALTEHNPSDEYDILVGFDPTGKANNPQGKSRKRRS